MSAKKATNAAEIIRKIGCDKLELQRGEGYWYFVYDDIANEVYRDHSVYCCYLNNMTVDQWVEIGKSFVAEMLA